MSIAPAADIEAPVYAYDDLKTFATALAVKLGLPADRATVQAEMLLEGDLMGHTTHGLHLLPSLLGDLESDGMKKTGEPVVLADHPAALHWDGEFLPGTWLIVKAIEAAREKLTTNPVVSICIRRAHHIAALVAYLRLATEQGLALLILNSDPSGKTVAAHGGLDRQITPNPLAFGYPTADGPVLIDISASSTANGWVRRWMAEKKKLPGKWIIDHEGKPSDEPNDLFGTAPGALLPVGGLELGYKGFALGLIVEALTSALTGYGRADGAKGTGGPVFLQVFDPRGFGGVDRFRREASFLAETCRRSRVRPGDPPVRMPGDRALAFRKRQLAEGVVLYPTIFPELAKWGQKLDVPPPQPLG